MNLDLTDCDDNAEATRAVREWCQQLGYRTKDTDDDASFVIVGARRWILALKANRNGNHRLLATCFFGTVPGAMSKEEWHKFCNDLNARLNIGKFCLTGSEMFETQFSLYFLETLNPVLFRNFIASIDEALAYVLSEHRAVLGAALE